MKPNEGSKCATLVRAVGPKEFAFVVITAAKFSRKGRSVDEGKGTLTVACAEINGVPGELIN